MAEYKKLEDEPEETKKGLKLSPEEEAEIRTGPEGLTQSEAARRFERDG
jgi:hypothetical protein